jgi:hypothetical protein
MNEQFVGLDPVPSWLMARYIAVATELERMHGAAFAAAFLNDIGIVPTPCNCNDAWRTAGVPNQRNSPSPVAAATTGWLAKS